MAIKHQLTLEVPETNNVKVLRVFDTSLYATGFDTSCGLLQVTSPGFNLPVNIDVLPYYNLVLNACTLGLQHTNCGETSSPLPDGIYQIRSSVAPNDKVFVEYYHLRTTQTMNKYATELAKLEMDACEPSADVKEKLNELRQIKSFIEAAKVKVEYAHEPHKGMELLVYAQKKLNKFSNPCINC